ncbi:unnamed protein product [Anisakis simplex]|uniref:DH domain-containing protein n=1 Tax=Anisakis simplex TaxID=6269 RepID=A0A158PP99_ANISI|nr:unnamed protein product [Anisakis simplex]
MNDLITVIRRIYRSSHSYPYPRTHSIVVLPSDRSPSNEHLDQAMPPTNSKPTRRPPLNRAIPTIPESKSNESITTQASERRDDSYRAAIPKSSSDQSTSRKQPTSSTNRIDSKLEHQSTDDRSIVIENKLAQNLATKKATSMTAASIRKSDSSSSGAPRSPLMSVAHSVRNRLTKLSNRFNRQDTNRSIRSSYSLSSMRQRLSDNDVQAGVAGQAKKGTRLESGLFKKSASMETRPTPNSTSSDSIKSSIPVPVCTVATTNSLPTSNSSHKIRSKDDATKMSSRANKSADSKGSECKKQRAVVVNASLPQSKESKNASTDAKTEEKLSNDQPQVCDSISPTAEITPLIQPKPIHSKNPPVTAATIRNPTQSSTSTQPKNRINPQTTSSRCASKVSATISGKNPSKIKQWRMKATAAEKSSRIESADNGKPPPTTTKSQRKAPEDLKNEASLVKKVERSFIPLISSTHKRAADRHSSRRSPFIPTSQSLAAPLAECESFRVGNSPAVEMPPTSFDRATATTTNSPGQKRKLLSLAKRLENGPATIPEETAAVVSTNKDVNSNPTTIRQERTDLNGNVEVTAAQTIISEHSQTSNNSNHNDGWAITSPAASSAETNRGLIDDEIKDQPLLIGGEFGVVDEHLTTSSSWRNQTEMCDRVHTDAVPKASQTSPVHMISSLNMASSGYMTSSGILNSPINDASSHSEVDSVDEQLSNLTICNGLVSSTSCDRACASY